MAASGDIWKTFYFSELFALETLFWLCNALPVYMVGSAQEITAVTVTVIVTD